MGAPTGNQFWKLRSKHGRDTLFADPELLWQAAEEYFEWCEKNPLIEIDFKGKDATEVHIPKMRAFTLEGLCLYLGCNTAYFRGFDLKDKDREKDFHTVFTRIYETIRNQKFTGAASGFLNPMIIARDLGLKDQSEVRNENINMNIEPTPEEAARIKEALDKGI